MMHGQKTSNYCTFCVQ